MKAIILLATLKKTGLSNTEVLSEFLAGYFRKANIDCNIIRLVDHPIFPGTLHDMGPGDGWPAIREQILEAQILVFATPVWWSNQSSELQRVIERMDAFHDEIMDDKPSRLEGKAGGVVITGDSDGAQHIIANVFNFFNAVGISIPAYASLSVLWEKHAKGQETSREELLKKYETDYAKTAEKMVAQLRSAVREHAARK